MMKASTSASAKAGRKNSSGYKHSQSAQLSKKILYRASHPLMVVAFRDNHHAAVAARPGDILEVIGVAQDNSFVIVSIKGEEFLALESDIRTTGELLSPGVVQSLSESSGTPAPADNFDSGNQTT
jgi:hypothetical protein